MQRTLLLISFFVGLLSVTAQTFRTEAPTSVSLDETFRVQYVVSTSDAKDFQCPSSPHFEILGGPSTSTFSSMQWVNGKRSSSSSITYTYILQAKHTGKLALPRPSVKVDGKTLHATPATITVEAQSNRSGNESKKQAPRSAGDEDQYDLRTARSISAKDLYVKCSATKTTLYEQEPVALTYKVYARNGVGLTNLVPQHKPEMKGFWTQEVKLPENLKPSYETIGGVPYRVFTFMQYVAFPQQSGTLRLPALKVNCSVVQRDPNIDPLDAFFNGGGNLTSQLQRSSEALTFNVKPLPTPRPAGFSGGVGQLKAEAQLLTSQPATNDIATYRITISGQGNMRLIKAPAITFPKSFDTYDPKTTDETRTTHEGISGKIVFDYTFVPREEGIFEIPASDFIYFDIASQNYRTIHMAAVPLKVKKGLRSREEVERELALRQSDIHPDHTVSQQTAKLGWGIFILILIALSLITWGIDQLMGMSLGESLRNRWNHSDHKRNKNIEAAEQAMKAGDAKAFYSALEQALSTSTLETESINRVLSQRYAPDAANPENMKNTMEEAKQLLKSVLLTIILGLAAITPAEAANAEISPADSIYNAGNNAYRMKEYGQAVLCYSRCIWMDANNEDARYNLALTQTHLKDQFSVPQEMFFTTWTRTLRTTHSSSTWLWYATLCFAGIMLCILLFRHSRAHILKRLLFYTGVIGFIVFLCCLCFAVMQDYDHSHNAQAVVMSEEIACYDSPVAHNKAALHLHCGTLVIITDRYKDKWIEIELPDTRHFWTLKNNLEEVRK